MIWNKKTYKNYSDEELMEMISKLNKSAFTELYERYSKPMLIYFKRLLWNDHEKAEDFVQDLFTKIIQQNQLFDRNRNFKTWIYAVANNMCKNEYKKQSVRKNTQYYVEDVQHLIADQKKNLTILTQEQDFSRLFEKELNLLDDKHKEVFELRHIDGLSIKEIADLMEINEGTVKSRLFYATKTLAEKLKMFQETYHE